MIVVTAAAHCCAGVLRSRSRVAASLLVNAGLPVLITHSIREFIDLAGTEHCCLTCHGLDEEELTEHTRVAVLLAQRANLRLSLRLHLLASLSSDASTQQFLQRATSFSHLRAGLQSLRAPRFPLLFHTKEFVTALERACQAMWDVYAAHVAATVISGPPSHSAFLSLRAHIVVGA